MSEPQPLLSVQGVSAFYGTAQALEDVSFDIVGGSTSIIGRNGMGKTTLCNAILAIPPARVTGSIRYRAPSSSAGRRTGSRSSASATCPRGAGSSRRSRSTSTCGCSSRRGSSQKWTVDAVYDLFPRLGERRRNGGAQLSGGEQQMLAIGRALLTNPTLLIMDEPSEGLAPAIIEHLVETFKRLEQEGLAILLIEQNLGMATAVAERQLVMVAGSIYAETTAAELAGDKELQRRFLGVEPLAERT